MTRYRVHLVNYGSDVDLVSIDGETRIRDADDYDVVLAKEHDARIRELEQQLSDGLAAWKANNAHFAGELQALRDQVRWVPVSERLPDFNEMVQLYWPHWSRNPVMGFRKIDGWDSDFNLSSTDDPGPTHWRPIGPLPGEG